MRHKVKKVKLATDKDHNKSLVKNLAMSLIIHEKIQTTETKARIVRPFVEKLITKAKNSEKVHAIRQLDKSLNHENSSKKIIEVLVPRYQDRSSGFTRTIKIGPRHGDNAPLVQIELV